jgi:phosphocarrier protein
MAGSRKISKELSVVNEFGIHARPAALIVQKAGEFDAEIMIEKEGVAVSAQSIMGLLTLEGYKGCLLKVSAEGADAEAALAAIEELFVNKFYED